MTIMSSKILRQNSQIASQEDALSAKEFDARFQRLKDACGAATDSGLAKALGITHGSIGVAKKRLKIPSGWVEKIAVKFGISTDWLFFGIGSIRQEGKKEMPPDTTVRDVDITLLATVIEVVEEVLDDSNKELVPSKKAQLIAAIYDLYKNSEKSVDKPSVFRLVRSVA